jgi:hypothetical protein
MKNTLRAWKDRSIIDNKRKKIAKKKRKEVAGLTSSSKLSNNPKKIKE